ncbi:type VI secretion system tube protein Hcp [Rubinisphaera italica]|uniref:Uncharacterized protein n=1 Tax=Rubinisphaera italica TaxID=2527969 RepID=A0A5C5XP87_9PLAN|nr:type VI secretion system tube protein Hcp [Rubinisphaera italica]TWT64203.1 hypothetical protein Pan54_49640 [Rubinisphaera italica]
MAIAHLAILTTATFPTGQNIWTWFDAYTPRTLTNNVASGTIQVTNIEIPGDSLVKPYRSWISIQSFRFDLSARSGSNSYSMSLIKPHDRTSPKLFKYCANDTKISAAVLELTHPDRAIPDKDNRGTDTGSAKHKTTYFLRDVRIRNFMSFGEDTTGTQNTSEEISLTYSGFGVIYDTINDGNVREKFDW